MHLLLIAIVAYLCSILSNAPSSIVFNIGLVELFLVNTNNSITFKPAITTILSNAQKEFFRFSNGKHKTLFSPYSNSEKIEFPKSDTPNTSTK